MLQKITLLVLTAAGTSFFINNKDKVDQKKNLTELNNQIHKIKKENAEIILSKSSENKLDKTTSEVIHNHKKEIESSASNLLFVETEKVHEQLSLLNNEEAKGYDEKIIELINKGYSNRTIKKITNEKKSYIRKLRRHQTP